MQIKQFYPYSPRKADFKQLSRSFVARESLLEELIDSIREQAAAEAIQHWMILGMRGMGKSHLIALLFQMIKNTADLNKDWIPLLMHEEEQSVFSLHTLFIRFLTQLGEEIVDTDKNKSRAISDFIDLQRDENKKQEEILESVVAFLKDFVRETGKRLLVLMENSDDIFSRYISKKNDIKQFRNMLQHDNFMMLIATSPTFFDEISKPSAPLYQFFRIRNLELLTYEQAFELLNRWKQSDKQLSGRKSKTMQFDINDYRLRALYHLTGGNPRVLLFLYMTITGEDGIRSAVEIFSKLLEEDLSTYYLSRLRDLSNQVQPIILALAESDKNLTQKEIAQKTFLPMKSIGTAMLRLEKDRLIRPVTEKKGKNTLYTLTDNLFRLWHQWRISVHNKEVIRAVVMCVAVWYKKEELEQWSMSNDIIGIHCKEALQYRATEHFKSLWAPFHQESESMIIRYLKNEDDQNLSRILATLKETGIDAERILGKVGKDLEATGDVDKAVKVAKIRLENNNEDVDAWMDLARLYFRQENFEEGVSALEKIVEFSPENVKAWRGLGFVCNMQGNHVRAEAVLKKSIELDPKDARAWKHLGVSFNNQKRFGEAQKALEKALELDPKDVDAWIWLSRACGGQEDYTGAEVASQKAVELDPEDADGWRWLARACSSQGNDKGAEEAFKRIVELDPEDVDGWKWLGISLHALKRYGEAQAALEKSVELDPEDTDCWKWLARTCGSQGNYNGAEAALRKAVEVDPKDADAWKWLGRAYGDQENYKGAEAALRKAVEIEPKDADTWKWLGISLNDQKRYEEAQAALEKSVELDEKDELAWIQLGIARGNQGNHKGAEAAFKNAVVLSPKDADAWRLLGQAHRKQKDYEAAESALKRAVALDPKDAEAWGLLEIVYHDQKDYERAEVAFRKAVKLNPDHVVAWKMLGDSRFFLNNYQGAETAYIRHIAVNPFEKEVHANLLETLTEDNRVPDILPILDNALSLADAEIDFKAFIHFMRAFVFLYQQDRTPFLKDLNQAVTYLNKLAEEKKYEVLGVVTGFLADTLREKNIRVHRAYVDELRSISTELAGVFRPMEHVLDYFEVIFSSQKDKKVKTDKAQRILDRITSEIREPVEKIIERITKNL